MTLKSCIEHVKREVPLSRYATELTELKPEGVRLVGRCPLPDHEDKTPSFHIWTDPNNPAAEGWYCFGLGCQRGGDLLDLFMLVEGISEVWEAMVALSVRYGVELPERPQSWYERKRRHYEVESAAEIVRKKVFRRRAFALLIKPMIDRCFPAPREHDEELARAWEDFQREMGRLGL